MHLDFKKSTKKQASRNKKIQIENLKKLQV